MKTAVYSKSRKVNMLVKLFIKREVLESRKAELDNDFDTRMNAMTGGQMAEFNRLIRELNI